MSENKRDIDIDQIDRLVKSIVEMSCEALELLDGKKREYADFLPKLSWLPKNLYDKYQRLRSSTRRLEDCIPSGIDEYPLKVIDNGYWKLCDKDGYIKKSLHRYIKEFKMYRRLLPTEIVHHMDSDKLNNDPLNLQIVSIEEHTTIHHSKAHSKIKDKTIGKRARTDS